ncbi:hypothetical protein KFE25_008801 [Diacronema lutheri]|uniref:Exonuclease 1 n=1 Tax=Diacronema lutheri TaxID=2081491 RepID=A0A8J5Y2T8_DIALT|nr:hypothetical protein KFE25_008801 [Diacronema lutheri]
MGIKGLLKFVDGAKRRAHLEELREKRVAVDAYVWLHRGARSCATELGTGAPTSKFTDYAMGMVGMFRAHGVEPLLVFDGNTFPCKASTEQHRATSRTAKRRHAESLRAMGAGASAVADAFYESVDITPEMARALQLRLRSAAVRFLVAPYEADVQLAYLCLTGSVHACCTEDSDLLVYQCPRVLYKLEPTGEADFFEFERLRELREGPRLLFDPWPAWREWRFTAMCILAGCDYLASLDKVGIKGAHKLCAGFRSAEEVLSVLQMRGHLAPAYAPAFTAHFRMSQAIFAYAPIFDPRSRTVRRLRAHAPVADAAREAQLDADVPLPRWPVEVARAVCESGDLNPITLEPFEPSRAEAVAPRAAEPTAGPLAVSACVQRKRQLAQLEPWTGNFARADAFVSTAAARAAFINP